MTRKKKVLQIIEGGKWRYNFDTGIAIFKYNNMRITLFDLKEMNFWYQYRRLNKTLSFGITEIISDILAKPFGKRSLPMRLRYFNLLIKSGK